MASQKSFTSSSDAYLISQRIKAYFNDLEDDWVALWCARHSFPEIAIQAVAGSQLNAFIEFSKTPYEALAGKNHEFAIPVTHIESGFTGDRYGEYLSHVPSDADWVTQTKWNAPWDDYFWWLAGEAKVAGDGERKSEPARQVSSASHTVADLDAIGRKYGTNKSSVRHDCLRFYQRFLEEFRHDEVSVLEIGVREGASVRMWQEYFPRGRIIGLDRTPETRKHVSKRIRIELADGSMDPT